MSSVSSFFLKKYMISSKRELLRFDSLFMIIGIIVSVAVLTVSMAIFDGYTNALKKTILGVNSHIYIFRNGEEELANEHIAALERFLGDQKEVDSFARIIMTEAMISNQKRIKGCLIRGIEWEKEDLPTEFRKYVQEGSYELQEKNDAVLGYRLADKMGLKIGDEFTLHSPLNSKVTPLGLKSNNIIFHLTGLYYSGMYEYDSKFLFCNLASAAEFAGLVDQISMVEVSLKDDQIENADYLAYKWETDLDEISFTYQISSWIDFNGNLFSLLHLQKWILFIILSFLILIASFNVVSSVSTSILEKRRDLGILKAYGASDNLLKQIFIKKALLTGVIAVILGEVIGMVIAVILSKQSVFLLKPDVYFFERIQVEFSIISSFAVFGIALLIIFFASLIPLRRISRLQVTSILRKE